MEQYSIEILHPKAINLLLDLEQMNLISMKKEINNQNKTTFRSLLLKAPTWNDEQFNDYKNLRESINKVGNAFT